jgi:hypothetical protein
MFLKSLTIIKQTLRPTLLLEELYLNQLDTANNLLKYPLTTSQLPRVSRRLCNKRDKTKLLLDSPKQVKLNAETFLNRIMN